ncbi:hydrogenase expression protein [Kocuria flava]|uniref:Hydrogenase expression protein n=1 Tax=Kocuria flava TaxID=446860 RepID=A0A0U2YY97_9MICC|nr:efflux RND transporter permease subunit [Kocuria flava]ALU40449.1 hydrogenase expression protein [Kocuria flava]GEO92650.1 multidrug transporter [Kocuria flava]
MFQLARTSMANRALIVLITLFVALFGVLSLRSMKQELIPSLEIPAISVVAAMPGASAEVVDEQVGRPLERALSIVEGLESSSSTSRGGLSSLRLGFEYGTDLDRARNQVERAIANVRPQLPEDVEPTAFAGSVADLPIVYLAVASDEGLSALGADLGRLTVPDLQEIEGVRSAEVSGAPEQVVSILPDPAALARAGAGPADIRTALEESGGLVPVGTVEDGRTSVPVQAGSPLDSLEAVAAVPLPRSPEAPQDAAPATVGAVAEVRLEDREATSITRTNGAPTLAISVTKTPDGDTVTISRAVREMIPRLEEQLGAGARITVVFDQAPYIEQSIHDLTVEGLLGLGFAVLVILVFLASLRSTLVTAVSIPLSLLATFIGIGALGYSLNLLTLAAITLSVGRVVDDSIVVIENIKRHYGLVDLTAGPGAKRAAILTAVREVAGAITASTLITVAVFVPIAFVGDVTGELFRPFALTTTIALLSSLVVSLTIVPVLAYWFLRDPRLARRRAAPRPAPWAGGAAEAPTRLARGYLPVLRATQRRPWATLAVSVLLLAGTAALLPVLPTNLLGDTGQNTMTVDQDLPAGTALEVTSEQAARAEQVLADTAGIEDVQVTMGTGGGLSAFLPGGGPNSATYSITTDAERNQEQLRRTVGERLAALEGAGEFTVRGAQGFTSSDVEIEITAPDRAALEAADRAVVEAVRGVDAAAQVSSNLAATQPTVVVTVDRAAAAARGLSEEQVTGALAGTVNPLPAGSVELDADTVPVTVGEGRDVEDVAELRRLPVPAGGGAVPLEEVADVEEVLSVEEITSSGDRRTATVSVTPAGDDLGATSAAVAEALAGARLPEGAAAELGGAASEQETTFRQLGLAVLAAVAIVYVVLVAAFKSLVQPLILLVSIPFAATGAVLALLATGVPLGLASLVGVLMLVGIVVTNAVVLIDLINRYRGPEHGMGLEEAVEKGAARRLRPIVMTALATVLAMTPMALGLTGRGSFISQPLAVVVIGGLVSSTLLTLVLVPVLYRLVEAGKQRRAARREERISRLAAARQGR